MSSSALSSGPLPEGKQSATKLGSVPSFSRQGRHPPPRVPSLDKPGILPAVQSLVAIIVIAVFIVTFTVQPFRIPSGSMEPTLMIGDFLLVNKQVTADSIGSILLPPPGIHRGDVIVFHYPLDPNMHLVKRIVGIPGDHIRLRGGHVFINGLPLAEPYAMYLPAGFDNFRDNFPRLQSADPAIDSRWWIRMRKLVDDGELIIPDDSYFVLGDNRNNSDDSRYWGFVPRENIVGRPLMIYFSLRQEDHPNYPAPHAAGISFGDPVAQSRSLPFARWDRIFRIVR
jgi:signal peptidase I